jgi:dephospho-CoA kinase
MIVGIAGGMCSGKDTVAGILRDDHSFLLVNSSDIVRRELRAEGTEISRANQRLLANERRQNLGGDYWVRKAFEAASQDGKSNHIAIVSLYSVSECRYIQTELAGSVIGVVTSDLTQRFERLLRRSDGSRDQLEFEEFLERDLVENSGQSDDDTNIGRVIALAQAIIHNDSDLQSLRNKVASTLEFLSLS